MKITLAKSALASAISAISPVVTSRSVSPVLAFAKLETAGRGFDATITATDLDCSFSRVLNVSEISEAGKCLIPVNRVKGWLGTIGSGDVTLEHSGSQLRLSSPGSGLLKLATYPVDDFPPVKAMESVFLAEADFAPIKHISWTMMETNGARPPLEAMFIEHDAAGIMCAATDGRKVGTVVIPARLGDNPWTPLALPAKYVGLVSGLGKCELLESQNSIILSSPLFRVTIRKSEHPVPQWRRFISNPDFPIIGSVTVMRDEMAQAIAQCHLLSGSEIGSEHGVRVTLSPENGVRVSCFIKSTSESFSHVVEGRIKGEFPIVILSTEHIATLFSLPDESPLRISFTGSKTMVKMNASDLAVDLYVAPMFPEGTNNTQP